MVTDRFQTWVEVNLDIIAHNVRTVKKALTKDTMIMAVVKADGYGHGMEEVAKASLENGATWLGVTSLEEGIRLREHGFEAPILLLGITPVTEADKVVEYQLVQTVCTHDLAEALSTAAESRKCKAKIHMKIDTGLSRFGVMPDEAVTFASFLTSLNGLELDGIFSHFASPYEEDAFNYVQFDRFMGCITEIEGHGIRIPIRHICNSAAMIEYPQMHLDMVRLGFILCNDSPARHETQSLPLKDALQWKTRVAYMKDIPKGMSIGYAQSYYAQQDMKIAIVQMGYADGYATALSNRGEMIVGGTIVPVVGKVAMSHVVVDITDVPGTVNVGDEVVLIGSQKGASLTVVDMATKVKAGDAETLCRISKKVPKVYYRNGDVTHVRIGNDG
jgi:alanine racemase